MIFSGKRVTTDGKPVAGSNSVTPTGGAGGAHGVGRTLLTSSQTSALKSTAAAATSSPPAAVGKASLGNLSGASPSSNGTANSVPLLRSRCQTGLTTADHTRARSPSSSSWW